MGVQEWPFAQNEYVRSNSGLFLRFIGRVKGSKREIA
jgi:hypothetical protein